MITAENLPPVFVKRVHALLGKSVPKTHSLVVAARHDEPAVGGETGRSNPVAVTSEGELEFLPVDCPHLGRREQGGREGGGEGWGRREERGSRGREVGGEGGREEGREGRREGG